MYRKNLLMGYKSVLVFYLFVGVQLLLVRFYYKCSSHNVNVNIENVNLTQTHNDCVNIGNVNLTKTRSDSTLFDIGDKYKTDKVYIHRYDRYYEKYFTSYRHTSVRLLEIGLGCGMPLGAGASALTWREYLGANADIHVIEYDEKCGRNWTNTVGKYVRIIKKENDMFYFHNNYLDKRHCTYW